MGRRLLLFTLILAVPLISFAVAEGVQKHFNGELRSAIQKQYPDADQSKVSTFSMNDLCEKPDRDLTDICTTNDNLNLMKVSAIFAGIIGLALLFLIWLSGLIARTHRILLLYLFRLGLYLTGIGVMALVVVHAGLITMAIYYGESTLVNRVHFGLIILIGIGSILGIVAMIPSLFGLMRKAQTTVIGKIVSKQQAPDLWKHVERISNELGALHPKQIIVGLDPNFFVTEANVLCLDGSMSGQTLYCSLPLLRILSKDEFSAVIGHELGHYKGLDTKFSVKFFPIYRGTVDSITSLQNSLGNGESARGVALLPAIAVLSYFLECFSVAESRISRSRELIADKAGVSISSTEAMASALVKVHAFSIVWKAIQEAVINALKAGNIFINISKTYEETVSNIASPEAFKGIADTHLNHPTDSHPPLAVRLKEIGLSINDVSSQALNIKPNEAAITLLPEAEKLEQDISETYQVILMHRLSIRTNEKSVNNL